MKRAILLAILSPLFAACPVGAPLVDGHPITCQHTSDCQPGEICDPTYGLCIGADGGQPADAGPSVCVINGVTYDAGTFETGQGCLQCVPSSNASGWTKFTGTPLPGACAETEDVCDDGACTPGCIVGGAFVAAGASGSNVCEVCNPAISQSGLQPLTFVPDAGCGAGEVCNAGQCASGCVIDGGFVDAEASEPGTACSTCNPATSRTSYDTTFTGVPAGTGCGPAKVCNAGTCAVGCVIGSVFFADGGTSASDCQVCDPAATVSGWSDVPDGTQCSDGFCQSGACNPACEIKGTLYTSGAQDPANPCMSCQPANSPTNWSNVPDGGLCNTGGGNYCVAGSCTLGCDIAGNIVSEGATSSANDCMSCQPIAGQPQATFSASPDGTPCATNNGTFCVSGVCTAECKIGGVIYANETVDAGNPDVCCNAQANATDWSAGFAVESQTVPTGTSPAGIAVGDLNHDSDADLVAANLLSVSVSYGNGDGTFHDGGTFPTGTGPNAVALADFNGDGWLDIAVSNSGDSTISVLLNQTDGGFTGASGSPSHAIGGNPSAITTLQFGGTGPMNIAAADNGVTSSGVGNEVSVLVNSSGTGSFDTVPRTMQVGVSPVAIVTADFNQDGNPDLAVAAQDGSVTVLYLTAAGFLSSTSTLSVTTGTLAGLATADINGDTKMDLLAVVSNGATAVGDLVVFLNSGGTNWAAPTSPAVVGKEPQALAAWDAAGDLAVVNGFDDDVGILINESTSSAINFAPQTTYAVGKGPASVAAGGFNSHPFADLAVTNKSDDSISVLLGQCP